MLPARLVPLLLLATFASSGCGGGSADDGPEELGSVASLHLEDGGLVEERSLRDVWPGRAGPAVEMWGPPAFLPAEGDAFFMGAKADVPEADGASRTELPLLRIRRRRVDTVTRYRGREFLRDGQNVGPVLLGARVVFAASPAGAWVGEHYGAVNPQIRDLPDERREWALFDPDGTPRGRVVTPPRIDLLDVRSGRVLAVHRDELGVETVRVYPVER